MPIPLFLRLLPGHNVQSRFWATTNGPHDAHRGRTHRAHVGSRGGRRGDSTRRGGTPTARSDSGTADPLRPTIADVDAAPADAATIPCGMKFRPICMAALLRWPACPALPFRIALPRTDVAMAHPHQGSPPAGVCELPLAPAWFGVALKLAQRRHGRCLRNAHIRKRHSSRWITLGPMIIATP